MTAAANKLNLFDFTMIVVGLVIGMGIFRTPVNVAQASPDTFIFFLTWIVGGVIAFCGALTYAEIGSRFPVTGGFYKVFSVVYHPAIAFAINGVILVSNAASLAGVSLIGGEYLTGILMPLLTRVWSTEVVSHADFLQNLHSMIAIFAILVFYALNLLGLKLSAQTQNVLMLIKITLIVLLITPLFFDASPSNPVATNVAQVTPDLYAYLQAFGVGLVAVSFTYGGYQQTINFGAEVHQPAKNIPLGIFLGISLIILLYLSINIAYIQVIGFAELKHTSNIAAIMAGKIFGSYAEQVLSVFLFLSVLAYVNVLLLSNPRVMCAMSEDNILPALFSQRNPKTDALTASLTLFALLSILIVFWAKEFDRILSFTIFLDCFGLILSAATLFVLRKKTQHLDAKGIYKMKLFPLLPLLFITAYVFVAGSIVLDYQRNNYAAAVGLAVMVGFIAIYFVLLRLHIIKPAPMSVDVAMSDLGEAE